MPYVFSSNRQKKEYSDYHGLSSSVELNRPIHGWLKLAGRQEFRFRRAGARFGAVGGEAIVDVWQRPPEQASVGTISPLILAQNSRDKSRGLWHDVPVIVSRNMTERI
jgi:hypothetical protein